MKSLLFSLVHHISSASFSFWSFFSLERNNNAVNIQYSIFLYYGLERNFMSLMCICVTLNKNYNSPCKYEMKAENEKPWLDWPKKRKKRNEMKMWAKWYNINNYKQIIKFYNFLIKAITIRTHYFIMMMRIHHCYFDVLGACFFFLQPH